MIPVSNGTPELSELLDLDGDFHVLGTGYRFIEGPVWSPHDQSLMFNDIQFDSRWRWTEATGAQLDRRPNWKSNGMTRDVDGELLVCGHVSSDVVRERRDGSREVLAFHYQGGYLNSPNDVVVRSDGSVYFTDPDYGRWDHAVGVARPFELGFHGVYRIPPGGGDLELLVDRDQFDQPNGLCFSPDESVLYVDDFVGVYAFPVRPDGGLGSGRLIHDGMSSDENPGDGNPDGMRCDERGNVWVTGRGGVWVMTGEGDLLGLIRTPEVCANLTWGGPDWHSLFLCTSTSIRMIRTLVGPAPLARSRVPAWAS
ncbi:SMP-30/gluconolactonase/LRE family protein [Nakamurella endophytica]|uniref:SMP-30/Gluconolactonase/LRE-like region domain-containing protein n=1 Tax=Nakamurella endophytica TaxID=1748367 RepID=A0A917SRK1_9ACTN|nr:SMP-30/gluconolactonase/LRE family protein [Nakamurella endophytica]GGL94898.1 hypothetical protein GCM10011594_13370 [Nakamurella endophytica]